MVSVFFFSCSTGEYNEPYPGKAYRNTLIYGADMTLTLIKKIENCKPFVSVSILFLCISIILTGMMIYF